MYADDGLVFPERSDTPSLTDMEAGITQNIEKSGWVKKDGKWLGTLKFLGLRYIPSGVPDPHTGKVHQKPILRGDTRSGSKLEFDVIRQFQCFLLSRYREWTDYAELLVAKGIISLEEIKTKYSGSITNGRFITKIAKDFNKLSENQRIALLFETKPGFRMISAIYNGSWQLNEPCMSKLEYNKGSWIHTEWGNYMYNCDLYDLLKLLENKYRHIEENFDEEFDDRFPDDVSWLLQLVKRMGKLELMIEYLKEYGGSIYKEGSLEDLARSSLFKWREDWLKSKLTALTSEEQVELIYHKNMWKTIYTELRINLYNASTFACSDLIWWISESNLLKRDKNPILYSRFLSSYSQGIEKSTELFELSKTKRRRRTIIKLRREGKTLLDQDL